MKHDLCCLPDTCRVLFAGTSFDRLFAVKSAVVGVFQLLITTIVIIFGERIRIWFSLITVGLVFLVIVDLTRTVDFGILLSIIDFIAILLR